jgi:hypothetical protein
MMAGLPSIAVLHSPLEGELGLGEDSFAWPHPTCLGEALFMTDDAVEGAAREVASWSHEGVQTTLAKMGDVIAVVARLGTKARRPMTDKVVVQA